MGLGKKDLNHRALFIKMSFADLDQYERLGEIFLCTKQRIVKKSNAPSCIYSLYYSDHNRAEQSCQINLKGHKHDQSVDTGPNSFVYYSTQSSVYTLNCQNHSVSTHQKLKGLSEINVPSSCKAETSQFILYPQSEFYQEGPHKSFTWSSNPSLSLLANNTLVVELEDALEAVSKIPGAPPLDPESFQRLQELRKPFYHRYFYGFSSLVIACLAILLIICAMSAVVLKNYKSNRKSNPSNQYRLKKLLNNKDTLEVLENLVSEGPNIIKNVHVE